MKSKRNFAAEWDSWVVSTSMNGMHTYMVGGKEIPTELVKEIRRHKK